MVALFVGTGLVALWVAAFCAFQDKQDALAG
jgi:hypothetical protein